MTRERFEAALVTSPPRGECGEVVFDFGAIAEAPCPEFRYETVNTWDDDGEAMDECWRAYLHEWECSWVD